MKREWDSENAGKMIEVMDEYRAMGHILNRGFRSMSDEKAENILQILYQASQKIESILKESDK